MSLKKHFKTYAPLYYLLLVVAVARILFVFDDREIWWDSGVYFGMAKYFWSAGTSGLWEHIRPVLWPAIIGFAWKIKLDMAWFARILELILTLFSAALVYLLGKRWFSARAALFASIIWSFSSIVFYLGFHEYTEIPAITLALLALLFFEYKRWFLAGFFVGLAFLMKFPTGIFIVVLGLVLMFQKQWKKIFSVGVGFVVPTFLFLVFNQFMYGDILKPLIDAHTSIAGVLGCNVLRFKPWWQYLQWILVDNWLNIIALVGLGVVVAKWKKQHLLLILAFAIPALYFMQLHCREYRYLVFFLPFIVLFTGNGLECLVRLSERWKKIKRFVFPVVILIVFFVSVFHAILFYYGNETKILDQNAERYFRWLETNHVQGEVWTSNPVVSVYTNLLLHKIYYPLYEKDTATDFNVYLVQNVDKIGAVFLDNCGGGIICAPDDVVCEKQLTSMRSFLSNNFKQAYNANSGMCRYEIYIH